jgi:hypothetical protein
MKIRFKNHAGMTAMTIWAPRIPKRKKLTRLQYLRLIKWMIDMIHLSHQPWCKDIAIKDVALYLERWKKKLA